MKNDVKIIECPRDAMQGIHTFIPTKQKVDYLNTLLKVGYHTIDCGSFVSPKSIPQMSDTSTVIKHLDLSDTDTLLSVIVANERGANEAIQYDEITYLGFPFSVSETFQKRNTNASIEEAISRLEVIDNLCEVNGKELVVYISMAFGNPYGDLYDPAIVAHWISRIEELGIKNIAISDTIGSATPDLIAEVFTLLSEEFTEMEFGAHLHTAPDDWKDKIEAAYNNGCKRFDGAILGYGGCPMAKDKLVGNMPTERLLEYFETNEIEHHLNKEMFIDAMVKATEIFNQYK
jgi:hydroxymethylglutaryl-CoA lyase